MKLISDLGAYFGSSPCGSGSALEAGPICVEAKVAGTPVSTLLALPHLPYGSSARLHQQQAVSGRQLRLLGQCMLLQQLFCILPKLMALGQVEACFGTELAP